MSGDRVGDALRTGGRGSRLLGAIGVCALLVVPVAIAGSAEQDQRRAAASADGTKNLKKKFRGLAARVAALEGKPVSPSPTIPTTLPPSGPAGGDLTGSYPNPTIGPDTITASKLAVGQSNVTAAFFQTLIDNDGAGTGDPQTSTLSTGPLAAGSYAVFATVNYRAGGPATGTCTLDISSGAVAADTVEFRTPAGSFEGSLALMLTTSIPNDGEFELSCTREASIMNQSVRLLDRRIVPIRLKTSGLRIAPAVDED